MCTYEIWNEPNGTFWTPQPDPAAYADLFVRAADAIHGYDQSATVMIGLTASEELTRSCAALAPTVEGSNATSTVRLSPGAKVPCAESKGTTTDLFCNGPACKTSDT